MVKRKNTAMTGGVFTDKVKKKAQNPNFFSSDFAESGGDEGDRTLDLTDANRTLSPASHDKQNIIDGKDLKIKQKKKKKGQICKIWMSSQGQSGKKMLHFGLLFMPMTGCETPACRCVRVAEKSGIKNA